MRRDRWPRATLLRSAGIPSNGSKFANTLLFVQSASCQPVLLLALCMIVTPVLVIWRVTIHIFCGRCLKLHPSSGSPYCTFADFIGTGVHAHLSKTISISNAHGVTNSFKMHDASDAICDVRTAHCALQKTLLPVPALACDYLDRIGQIVPPSRNCH